MIQAYFFNSDSERLLGGFRLEFDFIDSSPSFCCAHVACENVHTEPERVKYVAQNYYETLKNHKIVCQKQGKKIAENSYLD